MISLSLQQRIKHLSALASLHTLACGVHTDSDDSLGMLCADLCVCVSICVCSYLHIDDTVFLPGGMRLLSLEPGHFLSHKRIRKQRPSLAGGDLDSISANHQCLTISACRNRVGRPPLCSAHECTHDLTHSHTILPYCDR